MSDAANPITMLLAKVEGGDNEAQAELFRQVEGELWVIAHGYMRRERADHSLQTTILIDEAWMRLVGRDEPVTWQNRKHFYRAAARAMRRILIDHARRRRDAVKQRAAVEPDELGNEPLHDDVLALDEALEKLAQLDPRQSEIVEQHHFGGRTLEETAKILGVSRSTVKGDWRAAKAWLHKELCRDNDDA